MSMPALTAQRTNHTLSRTVLIMVLIGLVLAHAPIWLFIFVGLAYATIMVAMSFRIGSQFFHPTVCRLPAQPNNKTVALTFDDGPHPIFTPRILDVLKAHECHATFFCTGKAAAAHPQLVQRIIDEGHGIGIHSFSHHLNTLIPFAPIAQNDYENARCALESITGQTVSLFRPPWGVIHPWTSKVIDQLNLTVVGWSLRTFDFVKGRDAIVKKLQRAQPGDIVLLHDTKLATLQALEQWLPHAQEQSLELVKLNQAMLHE